MTEPRTRSRARPTESVKNTKIDVRREETTNANAVQRKAVGDSAVFPAEGVPLLARVRITDGVTLNMGDYSSFRRDVGLEVDVALGKSNGEGITAEQQQLIDVAFDTAKTWVEDRIDDSVEDAKAYFDGIE